MKVVFILLVVLLAVVYGNAEGVEPPADATKVVQEITEECKKEVEVVVQTAEDSFFVLKDEKCNECKKKVNYNSLYLMEDLAKIAIKALLKRFTMDNFDNCMKKFRTTNVWAHYDKYRVSCSGGKRLKLCEASDDFLKKTAKCIAEEFLKLYEEEKSNFPPECIPKVLTVCNKENLGKWGKEYFGDLKKNPIDRKGHDFWTNTEPLFQNKCSKSKDKQKH